MARFSKERLENTMALQGIKSYKELGNLMGYGDNINIKRFISDEIPLNVLSNLCNTLKVSRDYLMMESDSDNLKPLNIIPDPKPIVHNGGRPYSYISDPENYEYNNIDIDRLKDSIQKSSWTVARLNEFIEDDIYKILSNNANSILKSTIVNLSWALKQDRYYITGEADEVNSKYISYQRICKDQSHFINRDFMNNLTDDNIRILSDIINIPLQILESAKKEKIYVTNRIMQKITNAFIRMNLGLDINDAFVSINRSKYSQSTNNEIEKRDETVVDLEPVAANAKDIIAFNNLKSIIKLIDNLSTEDISTLGRYCTAEAERRTILESL